VVGIVDVIKKIEELMKEKGWTKYRLAKNAGLPQSTVISLLSGRVKNPSTDTLTKIASALGVSASYLLGESDPVLDELNRYESELDKKILTTLRLITDDEGYFFENMRQDIFNAIVWSGLNMSYAFHNASDADYFERFFTKYFSSPEDDFTDQEHEEAAEKFNRAYEIRTISRVLANNRMTVKERFLSELEEILKKHNIKALSAPVSAKELSEIPIEELVNHRLTYKGHVLTEEQKQHLQKLLQAAADMLDQK
jgi:transcriptional regulator with XRE-family HTH domain